MSDKAEAIYVVEYSARDRQFHIQTLAGAAEENLFRLLSPGPIQTLDWVVVAVAGSAVEANAMCSKLEAAVAGRQ